MPAPGTAAELLDIVQKSGVVNDAKLKAYVDKLTETNTLPAKPTDLAKLMVRDAVLTFFQAEQLLQGKWKRFSIGKYKVLEKIGSGGMGQVFLCEHKLMRRRVAVKVLPINKGADDASRDRFYQEARAVAALDHPNLVRAYDIDQDEGLHFLVMEFVDGINLQDLVKKSNPLELARTYHYIYGSAVGLQYAHEIGLVHRDIKPGNILIDRAGIVKILDMGLARFFNDEDASLTQKYDENVLGTADYLAPEQAVDSHSVDIRADLYALGGTFYYLLTGSAPFPDGSVAQKLLWHQTREPKPVRTIRPEIPLEIAAIVEKLLKKDKAERFQTPSELMAALLPWIQTPIPPPLEREIPNLSPAAAGPGQTTTRTSVPTMLSGGGAFSGAVSGLSLSGELPLSSLPRSGGSSSIDGPDKPIVLPQEIPIVAYQLPTDNAPNIWGAIAEDAVAADSHSALHSATPPPSIESAPVTTNAASPTQPLSDHDETQSDDFLGNISRESSIRTNRKPASSIRTSKPTLPKTLSASDRKWRRIALIALPILVLTIGAGLYFSLRSGGPTPPTSTTTATKTLYVSKDVKSTPDAAATSTSLLAALSKARGGETIAIWDATLDEPPFYLRSSAKLRDVTIEPGNGHKTITWTIPPGTKLSSNQSMLELNGMENFTLRGISFDGAGKFDVGIMLSGPMSKTTLENITVQGTKTIGIRIVSTNAESSKPLTLKQVRILANTPGQDCAVQLDGNRGSVANLVIHHCRFEGSARAAVRIDGAMNGVKFEQNRFYNFESGLIFGGTLEDNYPMKLQLIANTFYQMKQAAFELEVALPTKTEATIRQNAFLFCNQLAISKPGTWTGLVASENARDDATKDGTAGLTALALGAKVALSVNADSDNEFLTPPPNSPLGSVGPEKVKVGYFPE